MNKELVYISRDFSAGIGIPDDGSHFIKTNSDRDLLNTQNDIRDVLNAAFDIEDKNSIINNLPERFKISPDVNVQIDFMNYGNTQLVYLATLLGCNYEKKLAVLINQPITPLGVVKEEFENLKKLSQLDPKFIIKPYTFFSDGKHELYVSPYIEKAKCIYGGYQKWGIFDPDPFYHFEPFTKEISDQISTNMIALLVHYYDKKNNLGIAKTQISGDDFILTKDWDNNGIVLNSMRIIAARKMIHVSLKEYLDIIRSEFSQATHYNDEIIRRGEIKVNCKSSTAIPEKIIERGISLGLSLKR
ncbi:MAG: hypothetical protein PHO75_03625 [Candidatus Shapirobacteria bacterium]|nr:hypothetical protein [Candidatus Shapirobacteria bacterium]